MRSPDWHAFWGGVIPNQAEAAECPGIVEVTPNYVEDCSNTAETAGGTGTIVLNEKTKENLTYTFKFDVEYDSYAHINIDNTIIVKSETNDWTADTTRATVSMGASLENMKVYETKNSGSQQSFYKYMTKGTYYLKLVFSLQSREEVYYYAPGDRTATVCVNQDRKNVELGSSPETAIPLTDGVNNEGAIIEAGGSQYFAFTLDKKANIEYSAALNTVWSAGFASSLYSFSVGLYRYDSGAEKDSWYCGLQDISSYSKKITVDAGKYYIKVKDTNTSSRPSNSGASSQCYVKGFFKVNQYVEETPAPSPSVTPVPNPTPAPGNAANTTTTVSVQCTKYKKNTKVIKGIATPKAKIVLTVKGKKYTTVVSNKGNFSVKLKKKLKKGNIIKVYAKLAGVKSKTVKYKVK